MGDSSNTNRDRIKQNLFEGAMKGKWEEVVQIYRDNPWIHDAKITRSGATALHIAVSDGKEDIVEELIKIITTKSETSDISKVLRMDDELGNTPLHTAAMLGKETMCTCIASKDENLIGIRNKDSETPFFTAALHGHKLAFLHLHDLCKHGKDSEYGRRNEGDTILHCAISGDYFGQPFHYFKEFHTQVNNFLKAIVLDFNNNF